MFIVLIKTEDKIYIMANEENIITGFNTLKKALNYFENSYNSAHSRSYESSMSACLNYITFQPSIIEIKDIEDIKINIASKKPKAVRLNHVSGFMNAITTRNSVKMLWENGKKPQLIKSIK